MGSSYTDSLEVLTSKSGPLSEQKIALTRLSGALKKQLVRGSSDSFDFFFSAFHAVSKVRGSANAELRMSCIFDCCNFFYLSGHTAIALDCARYLDRLAAQTKRASWTRKATSLIAVMYADCGNIPEALIRHFEALELARNLRDLEGEAIVLVNLGVALNYAGLYREALPCFEAALAIAKTVPSLVRYAEHALTNIAQSHLHLANFRLGFEAITECLATCKEPTDANTALDRTIREFTYVQLALEIGELNSALVHSELCTRYGTWGGARRGKVVADVAAGLCQIHGGSVEHGLSTLELTLTEAADPGAFRATALGALVKACDAAGQPERALGHLTELLAHIRSTRQKSISALLGTWRDLARQSDAMSRDLWALEQREAKLRARVAERELFNSRLEMLERLAVAADLRNDFSGEHGLRVGKLASLLAHDLRWIENACLAIETGGRLHDIGKVAIPDYILLTSEQLREAERQLMKTHASVGAELLSHGTIPQLRMAEEIAKYHHEWWDGTGYPSRLAGNRIPVHARIVSIADVFDALTHGRPYAGPWPIEAALNEIESRANTQFDPDLVERFTRLVRKLQSEHRDLDSYLGSAGRNSPFALAREKIKRLIASPAKAAIAESSDQGGKSKH
jgi:putative two-component system response regulator